MPPPDPNGPLRLALISRRYPPQIGGGEKVMSYLAVALAAEGAEVTVLCCQAFDVDPPSHADEGPRVVRLPSSPVRGWGTVRYMTALNGWLRKNPVDLAYVSMLKHDAFAALGAGRARGFPVVLRPEGAGATGDIAWQGWGRGGRIIARRCKRADAVVAISPAVRAELLAAGYEPARVVDLPNGVPVPDLAWSPRPDWSRAPTAVFVGRLAPEKELGALVDAWPIVRRSHPAARLILIGEGPERLALESRIAGLGLTGAIELPGICLDPRPALRSADLFVLPSREEGMSIALLEALALGLPAVASDIPGNRRLIDDFETGRLASPDDPPALAAAILDQWLGFDRAVRMGRKARERVIAEFSVSASARLHLSLFRRLVAARDRTSL
ncbi:glycosyltransferase family 4 protein [Isosphaeraceae bacterium EP7]